LLFGRILTFVCSPVRSARVGGTSSFPELQLQSLLLPSESLHDRNETQQVKEQPFLVRCFHLCLTFHASAKCTGGHGAELRRQIDEKEREKKAKRGFVQQQQNQNVQNLEQGIYSRNRYEFERARIAGGYRAIGMDAAQRSVAGSSHSSSLEYGHFSRGQYLESTGASTGSA